MFQVLTQHTKTMQSVRACNITRQCRCSYKLVCVCRKNKCVIEYYSGSCGMTPVCTMCASHVHALRCLQAHNMQVYTNNMWVLSNAK